MRFKDIRSSYSNVLSSLTQVPTIVRMSTEPDFWPVDRSDKLLIIKRNPDYWAGINALFESNEEFRLLCQEYGLATDTLAKLNSPSDTDSIKRREEYREIVRELETEIMKYIDGYAHKHVQQTITQENIAGNNHE